jgi:hypothetical protein
LRAAHHDTGVAATCLLAMLRGEDNERADAGAVLLAEALLAITMSGVPRG